MILVRARPDCYKTTPKLNCPACNTTMTVLNAENYNKKMRCPICGQSYHLKIEVTVTVTEPKEPKSSKAKIPDFLDNLPKPPENTTGWEGIQEEIRRGIISNSTFTIGTSTNTARRTE